MAHLRRVVFRFMVKSHVLAGAGDRSLIVKSIKRTDRFVDSRYHYGHALEQC